MGKRIVKGEMMEEIGRSRKEIAEDLENQHGVSMSLCEEVHTVLWKDNDIKEAMKTFGAMVLIEKAKNKRCL